MNNFNSSLTTSNTMEVINPATGKQITQVKAHSRQELDDILTASASAYATWFDATPSERGTHLARLADAIDANAEELARLESLNVGKPLTSARIEIAVGADMLRFFAGAVRRSEAPAAGEYAPGYTSMLRREPLGIVGVVAPWNYPFMLTCTKIGAVIGAGNALVLKPADATPLSAIRLAEIAADILPPNLFTLVTGTGPEIGQGLIEHPDVRSFALTGGTATGRRVAELGGRHLKRLHLELGSKNAALVFDDARLEEAAAAIVAGAFVNSGQDCGAASRVLIHASIYERLVPAILREVENIRVGDPLAESTTMGPVFTHQHQRHVLDMIERAQQQGGEILAGGSAIEGPGAFIRPTVITNVEQDSEVVQHEVFGPVITLQRFFDDEQAIRMANHVDAGLAASVFTNDIRRGMNAVRKLHFGTTWINDHIPMALEFPWGGYKNAGNGCDNSAYALEQFSQFKHVMIKL